MKQGGIVTKAQRGNLKIHDGCHPFVRTLFAEMNAKCLALREVADKAGISSMTLSNWRTANNPALPGLIAVANVLGFELSLMRMM